MNSQSTVRFLLDGEVREISDCDPTRTVLQYLREDLNRTGTKEGCAEGDCGACTVVVVEPDASGDGLRVRAVNSCIQFLPTLDGKELLTVESLLDPHGRLHPVQQALVEHHGSQCGFCTPGFVMSLFALYKNHAAPTRRDIDDALAGNLCRCTGYRPIVAAAQAMYAPELRRDRVHWLDEPCDAAGDAPHVPRRKLGTFDRLRRAAALETGSAGRRLFAPRDLGECAALLQRNPDAVILAGGTDVGLWVTKQYREPGTLVYIGRVPELCEVSTSATHLEIGAAATITDAMPLIVRHFPALEEMLRRFASPPIRNVATLGGNIANGSPIGDSMPALMVLGASLVLRAGDAQRELPLEAFYRGYRETALGKGEFIERIRIPLPDAAQLIACYKVSKRFDQDISAVCAAFCLGLDGDRVRDIRIACGGMAAIPKRAMHCEAVLRGARWSEATVRKAMRAFGQDFEPITDMRASAAYRSEVCANLLFRFFMTSTAGETQGLYGYGR